MTTAHDTRDRHDLPAPDDTAPTTAATIDAPADQDDDGPRRRGVPAVVSLAALALGGFVIGTTEFASMGVLPDYARDLGVSVPQAGAAISAYALGVVVGAPVLTLLGARWPRKRLAVALAALVAVANLSSALVTSFPAFVVTRFLSGVPHGAYFGTAAVLAAALVPPQRRARAIATTMAGLMLANVAGVPVATWLGQGLGWRWAYLAVAVLGGLTVAAVATLVPQVATAAGASIRRELTALARPQVWLTVGVIAAGFGGTFAMYSYVAPTLVRLASFPVDRVPIALALFGAGAVLGNQVGARFAERDQLRTIELSLAAVSLVLLTFTFTVHSPVTAAATLFVLGFVGVSATAALVTRLMDVAADGPSLAAALHHAAFNVANALGAALGGLVLAAGLGYTAPAGVGAVLPLAGLLVLSVSKALQRRTDRRAAVG